MTKLWAVLLWWSSELAFTNSNDNNYKADIIQYNLSVKCEIFILKKKKKTDVTLHLYNPVKALPLPVDPVFIQ